MQKIFQIIFIFIFLCLSTTQILAQDANLFLNEKLTYTIMWQGINIGTATLSLTNKGTLKKPVYQISVDAKTNDFFSSFYPVQDVIHSTFDPLTMLPLTFDKSLKEGKRQSEESTIFSHKKGIAIRRKGKTTQQIKIPSDAQDPISCLYKFRTLDFNQHADININSKDKNHVLSLDLIKKDILEFRKRGAYKTIVVKPQMAYEGIFMHNGDMSVWFTDDEYKVPLKMECRLKFGKATAVINLKESYLPYYDSSNSK